MSFLSFTAWLRNPKPARQRHPARRFRPALEVLEDRAVPATLRVNTTLDVLGHDNGTLSLRQAIIDANAAPKPDTIIVPAGTYTLTLPGINEDAGLTGDLDCTGDLTIKGVGAGATTIDAAGLDRAFHVLGGGNVTLSGLTITGGVDSYLDDSGVGILSSGGGILNEGTLTVRDCTVSGNFAVGPYGGGGIANFGALTVHNTTLSGNSAGQAGQQTGGVGGGIFNQGTLTVTDSTLSGNSADSGGGIWNDFGAPATVRNTTLSGNSGGEGGGIFNGGTLTVSNSAVSGNSATDFGGGIANEGTLTVRDSIISSNSAIGVYGPSGGGIFNDGLLTVSNSTVSSNSAVFGGGIYNIDEDPSPSISVTITNSTLSGNTATDSGGAIYNFGAMTIRDCALFGNTATNFGGGIANFTNLTIRDSILLGNSAPLGGDLYNAAGAYLSVLDSIIGDRYDA